MEKFWQRQIEFDKIKKLGYGGMTDYFGERGKMYRKSERIIPRVVQWQTDDEAATSTLTSYGEHMETFDSIP
jgi:hypothetical protein